MNFEELPLGSCFRMGRSKAVHRKNSPWTYLSDGVGPEETPAPSKRVRAIGCPRMKALIELGNAKRH